MRTRKKYPPIYFLSYTGIKFSGRTTQTKSFGRYKQAIGFAIDNGVFGYIVKQDENGNSFKKFLNGFEPSATEQRSLESTLKV